jgi:hypothetical protein
MTDEIFQAIDRINAAEIARRRDYYAYLTNREPQEETLEEHVEKYAALVRTGGAASPEQIRELEAAQSTRLPGELQDFYRTLGKLQRPHHLEIFAVAELGEMRSMGLIDMMNACWGYGRFEFDPAEGLMSQEMIDALNAAYKCAGWVWSDRGEEGHDYIWFDRDGRFGTTFFHQDEFDELYEESLVPMLERSPAAGQPLSGILLKALEHPWRS